jgi:hypothetical protein
MMTVRFPNGQAVQYNAAENISGTFLVDSKGHWIARVPDDCIVEACPPCRVYDALQEKPLEELTKEVRALKRKITKR